MGRPDEPGEGRAARPRTRARRRRVSARPRRPGDRQPHAIRRPERRPDRRAERGRALPELIEATAMRLVSYFGPTMPARHPRRRPGHPAGRATPGFDLDPDALDDLRRRAAALEGAAGHRRSTTLELVAPVIAPGQDRVRRAQLPRARQRGRPAAPDQARSCSRSSPTRSSPTASRSSGRRAPTRSTSRSSSASSSGPTAHRVSRADALDHVAGYVVVNDVSARDWQGIPAALAEGEVGDGQWLRAKGSDTFLPMGSVFVTADEIPDPQALRLRSWRIPGSRPRRRHARS